MLVQIIFALVIGIVLAVLNEACKPAIVSVAKVIRENKFQTVVVVGLLTIIALLLVGT